MGILIMMINNLRIFMISHIYQLMEEPLISKKQEYSATAHFTEEFIPKLMELEGECKIKDVMYLRINYLKAFFLGIILVGSIIGLFLLKYFVKLRAIVFYSPVSFEIINTVTHVYVKGRDGEEEISRVDKVTYNESERVVFEFKKLKYEIFLCKPYPLGFPYIGAIGTLRQDPFLNEGLSSIYVSKREQFYGKNEHKVEVPGYFQFLFDTMTKPFFVCQYLVAIIFILQNFALFSYIMIVSNWLTTTINYILLNRSYNKIKQTAEKLFKVKVFRNGIYLQIDNTGIVPGDLYEPAEQIPCDSIVVKGELFVDECNLTGENVPILKSKIIDDAKHSDKNHWLYEGSRVQTMKQHTLALAVNVGFASQRGRIIRKILNKTLKQPQFFTQLIVFQLEVVLAGIILYFATLPQLLSLDIDSTMVLMRLGNFITFSFPISFPVLFNLAYSFCLVRLYRQNIIGTQAEKSVQSGRMKTLCFDKTGTLTENKMSVLNVHKFGKSKITKITKKMNENPLISSLFACCNSVQSINGQVKGDEIDLRMFEFVQGKLSPSHSADIVREVIVGDQKIDIIKINQYQSQFQSMSVLVKDPKTGKYYIFAKGSPQMIHHYSVKKVEGFQSFIRNLSFSGYRSIGFSYKQIRAEEVEQYMLMRREEFLTHTSIMGVITFANQLKSDAKQTIHTLTECDINTKIITGDNIFLGIQTAIMVGMIPRHAKITVIEGKKYNKDNNSVQALNLLKNQAGHLEENTEHIQNFDYKNEQSHYYAIDDDFIKQNPQFLHERVKVFARISPQNKALIVRRHKQKLEQPQRGRTFIQRMLAQGSFKVGMVGDGANDLIAIKEAHVGIGISSSDAVFSACFAVRSLEQILQIIKESKNVQGQIIQMMKYSSITMFFSVIATLVLSYDSTFFTPGQISYKTFLAGTTVVIALGLTSPAKQMTKYINNTNFLDLESHLSYWSTLIIYSCGLIATYGYYTNSPNFVANTHTKIRYGFGWYGLTQSSTVTFIAMIIACSLLPFPIYIASPWKLPIWKNKLLTGFIILNILLIVAISLMTSKFALLGVQPIDIKQVLVIWAIMLGTTAIVYGVNKYIEKAFSWKKQVRTHHISSIADQASQSRSEL